LDENAYSRTTVFITTPFAPNSRPYCEEKVPHCSWSWACPWRGCITGLYCLSRVHYTAPVGSVGAREIEDVLWRFQNDEGGYRESNKGDIFGLTVLSAVGSLHYLTVIEHQI